MEIEEEINQNSKCSICSKSPIVGLRYICLQCSNFEICQQCENNFGEKHGHELLTLTKNNDLIMYKNYLSTNYKLKNLTLSNESPDKKEKENINIDISKCSSICTNLKSIYITKNNNNFLPIEVILKNPGQNKWPFPCFFVCDEVSSQIKGDKIKLKPNNSLEYKFNIKINLQKIKRTGTYISEWQLRNEKDEKFGEKITFKIKVIFDKKLILKSKYKKDFKSELQNKINEIKAKPYIALRFSVNSIKNALLRTKGNKDEAIKLLITQHENKGENII